MNLENTDYESPALEVVEIETENYCFSVSAGEGDGTGNGADWPYFQ